MAYDRLTAMDHSCHSPVDGLFEHSGASQSPIEDAPCEDGPKNEGLLDANTDEHRIRVLESIQNVMQRFNGWKGGLTLAIFADTLVLLCALAFILVIAFRYQREGLEAILIDGSCSETKRFSTWLHLIINIASTILLSTSSYAMQCLTSPTRVELDRAHGKGRYLDVGIGSVRNLFNVSRRRAFMFVVIVITSIPIHLLANSAVYATQGSTEYLAFAVSQDYQEVALSPTTFSTPFKAALSNQEDQARPPDTQLSNVTFSEYIKDIMPNMTHLSNADCIREYTQTFRAGRRHVLAVSNLNMVQSRLNNNNDNFTSTLRRIFVSNDSSTGGSKSTYGWNWTESDTSFWPCSFVPSNEGNEDFCDAAAAVNNATHFTFGISGYPIDYCLSEVVPETCKLRGNIPIAIVVLICATLKSATLFITLRTLPEDILATIGDAISSFLSSPEPATRHCSLLDLYDIKGYERYETHEKTIWQPNQPFQTRWNVSALKVRSCHAIPLLALYVVFMLQIIFLAFGVGLLVAAIAALPATTNLAVVMRRTGLGSVNLKFTFKLPTNGSKSGLAGNVLFVNMPQLLLSIYYFSYNQCWTAMFVAREWASIGMNFRSLRVSKPEGAQRSNYFLTIPYRFAIPLQIAFAFHHWLLSQCIFLVRVDVKSAEPFVKPSTGVVNAIGYSPLAVTIFVGIFSTLIVILWFTGVFIRLKSPIPLVSGCSLAISAGCHPPADEIEPWLKPVKWGVIPQVARNGFLHCAISSEPSFSPEYLEYVKDKGTVAYFE